MTKPYPIGRANELMKWRRVNYPSLTMEEASQLYTASFALAERELSFALTRHRKHPSSND